MLLLFFINHYLPNRLRGNARGVCGFFETNGGSEAIGKNQIAAILLHRLNEELLDGKLLHSKPPYVVGRI